MRIIRTADERAYRSLKNVELRRHFLIEDLFRTGHLELVYTDADRAVVG